MRELSYDHLIKDCGDKAIAREVGMSSSLLVVLIVIVLVVGLSRVVRSDVHRLAPRKDPAPCLILPQRN